MFGNQWYFLPTIDFNSPKQQKMVLVLLCVCICMYVCMCLCLSMSVVLVNLTQPRIIWMSLSWGTEQIQIWLTCGHACERLFWYMVNMGGCRLSPLWVPPSLCRWVWTTKGQAGQYLSFLSLAHGKLQKIHEVETAHHAPSSSVVNRVVCGMCYGLSNGTVALPSSPAVRCDIWWVPEDLIFAKFGLCSFLKGWRFASSFPFSILAYTC